ncbi:MAG: hypothetical protein KIS76_19605 [Pyrinomonadaceae bacterium]|nr:hypothetical protein [Pyrinomonadaceae bacterium]
MSGLSINPSDEAVSQSSDAGISAARYEQMVRDVRAKQSFGMAIVGGFAAAVIAAFVWALVTYITNFQIGYMAIGVGFLVGLAVRHLGKGVDTKFGIVGCAFALFGCVLGNFLTSIIVAWRTEGVDLGSILLVILTSPAIIVEVFTATFSPIDLLFYGIAIYAGFRYGIMEMPEEEMINEPPAPTPNPAV